MQLNEILQTSKFPSKQCSTVYRSFIADSASMVSIDKGKVFQVICGKSTKYAASKIHCLFLQSLRGNAIIGELKVFMLGSIHK
jgi:hypothetical protein